jgi:hypothetical protein
MGWSKYPYDELPGRPQDQTLVVVTGTAPVAVAQYI